MINLGLVLASCRTGKSSPELKPIHTSSEDECCIKKVVIRLEYTTTQAGKAIGIDHFPPNPNSRQRPLHLRAIAGASGCLAGNDAK